MQAITVYPYSVRYVLDSLAALETLLCGRICEDSSTLNNEFYHSLKTQCEIQNLDEFSLETKHEFLFETRMVEWLCDYSRLLLNGLSAKISVPMDEIHTVLDTKLLLMCSFMLPFTINSYLRTSKSLESDTYSPKHLQDQIDSLDVLVNSPKVQELRDEHRKIWEMKKKELDNLD